MGSTPTLGTKFNGMIRQSLNLDYDSDELLVPITKDSHGTVIENGARVAFNKSGNVVLGRIVEVKQNVWKQSNWGRGQHYFLKFKMIVEDEEGVESTLKNPNSFVII